MQHLSWNDLRIILTVARAQSLSGAAILLDVNATTISRRLKLLEKRSGSPLVLRDPNGNLCLTQTGLALADHAEGMERHANLADTLLGRDKVLSGTVRLTAVPFLLNHFVVPNIHDFTGTNPALQISLVPDSRNLSLTRREVDLAIRFGEPNKGGDSVLAQRLGKVTFSAFTANTFDLVPEDDRPWLSYDPVAAHLPQAGWTDTYAKTSQGETAKLLMHDLETAYQTVLCTPYRAILPDAVVRNDKRLVKLRNQAGGPKMNRDVWLMRHRDMRGVERIDATVKWLTAAKLFDED